MHIICDGLELCDAVLRTTRAISNKVISYVLEGVKLSCEENVLTVSATDLEIGIERKLRADVIDEGEVILPGKLLSELLKKMTNEKVELETEGGQVKITYLSADCNITMLNNLEYPSFKKIDKTNYFSLTGSDLKSLINKSIFAAATEDTRPILKGCHIEVKDGKAKIVALDGFRLAILEKKVISASGDFSLILPARCLQEIVKDIENDDEEIKIYICENHVMTEIGGTKIISRLMQGKYIAYEQILPTECQTEVVVNKLAFTLGLERAVLMSKATQNSLVRLNITEDKMTITSNSEVGNLSEIIDITKDGADILIAFNAQYILDCLKNIDEEFVTLKFNKSIHPCKVIPTGKEDEILYLILPVRML